MMDMIGINHVAVVVENLEESLSFWEGKLGLNLDHIETVESMAVRIAMLPLGDSKIELVEPVGSDSGIARFLRERGPGLHHLCLEVEDVQVKLHQLSEQGVRLIDEVPQRMDDGRQLAFLHPRSTGGVLIELYQLPEGKK
ncbi:MAG: methylmalonyl-CoA epimerase [Anaerolineales bacterium]|nr:methylmalonyl-CoA epimerase [Anaerolineales bacterium]